MSTKPNKFVSILISGIQSLLIKVNLTSLGYKIDNNSIQYVKEITKKQEITDIHLAIHQADKEGKLTKK